MFGALGLQYYVKVAFSHNGPCDTTKPLTEIPEVGVHHYAGMTDNIALACTNGTYKYVELIKHTSFFVIKMMGTLTSVFINQTTARLETLESTAYSAS